MKATIIKGAFITALGGIGIGVLGGLANVWATQQGVCIKLGTTLGCGILVAAIAGMINEVGDTKRFTVDEMIAWLAIVGVTGAFSGFVVMVCCLKECLRIWG